MDDLVDKLVDKIVDDLSNHALEASSFHRGDLDNTMLRQLSRAVANKPPRIEPGASPSIVRASQRPPPLGSKLPLLRRDVVSGGLVAATLLASVLSGSQSVTSQPQLSSFSPSLEEFEALNPWKQTQVQSVLQDTQIKHFLNEIGVQKDELQAQIETAQQMGEQRTSKARDLRRRQEQVSQQIHKIEAELADKEQHLKQPRSGTRRTRWQEQQKHRQMKQLEWILQEEAHIKGLLEEQERLDAASPQKLLIRNAIAELERKKQLEARLTKRAATLAALDAQPDWLNYAAAFVASCLSTLVMHPVDTLKTREVTHGAAGAVAVDSPLIANEMASHEEARDGKKKKKNSVSDYLELYQGIQGALLKEGPPSALYLGVYEAVKSQLLATPTFASYPLLVYLIAGALGESIGSVVRAPAEAIKSRVQAGVDPSTGESIRRVLFDDQGRANIVRAWSASLWRDVPFGAIQLAIFEGLKSYFLNSPQSFLDIDVDTLGAEVLFGATGGAIGSFLTVPMDVVTTRIMTQAGDDKACKKALGFVGMTKKVWAEGGWRALLTGWKARTGYWAPAISIFLSCYSSLRHVAIAASHVK